MSHAHALGALAVLLAAASCAEAGLPRPRSLLGSDRTTAPPAPDAALAGLPLPPGGLAWRFAVPGFGLQGPVVVGGKVIVAGFQSIHALEPTTGGELWRRRVDGSLESLRALGTAIVWTGALRRDDERRPVVAVLDPTDGSQRWRREFEGQGAHGVAAVGADCLIVPDYLPSSGFDESKRQVAFTCLDAATGASRWRQVRPADERLVADGAGALYVVSAAGRVERLSAVTGLAEGTPRDLGRGGWPLAIAGDQVVHSSREGISALSLTTGREVWRSPVKGGWDEPRAVSRDGTLYCVVGWDVVALDSATGAAAFRRRLPVRPPYDVAVLDDTLLAGTDDDWVYGLDRRTGEPRWRFLVSGLHGGPVGLPPGLALLSGWRTVYAVRTRAPAAVAEPLGTELWVHRQRRAVRSSMGGGQVEQDPYRLVDAPPTVSSDWVYFPSGRWSPLLALDRASGALRWTWAGDQSWIDCAPALTPTRVVFPSGTSLVALDSAQGRESWRASVAGQHNGDPVVQGDRVLVGTAGGYAASFGADDGRKLWEQWHRTVWDHDTRGASPIPRMHGLPTGACLVGQLAVFGLPSDGLFAVDVATGQPRWHVRTGESIPWLPRAAKDVVLAAGVDWLYAVGHPQGKARWKHRLPGAACAAPVVTAALAVVGTRDGSVCAVDLGTGKRVWTRSLGCEPEANLHLDGTRLYVPCRNGVLHALDAATGAVLTTYRDPGWCASSLRVVDGVAYFGTHAATVRAVRLRP